MKAIGTMAAASALPVTPVSADEQARFRILEPTLLVDITEREQPGDGQFSEIAIQRGFPRRQGSGTSP